MIVLPSVQGNCIHKQKTKNSSEEVREFEVNSESLKQGQVSLVIRGTLRVWYKSHKFGTKRNVLNES